MQHRVIASPVLAGLVALGLLASAGAQATMYRYTDENGQLVIGNTIPQEATKRGYEIQNLHVDEDYRRQGAAKALLTHILEVKRAQGVRKFALSVSSKNEKARAFYKAFGFKENEMKGFLRCKIEE